MLLLNVFLSKVNKKDYYIQSWNALKMY